MMIIKMLSLRKTSPKFTFQILYSIFNITPVQNYHLSLKNITKINSSQIFKTKFISSLTEPILSQTPDDLELTLEIKNAIYARNLEDTWRTYEKCLHTNGLPNKFVLTQLISSLTETFDSNYLQKAYDIVNLAFDQKKFDVLERETLVYLSYILARNQMVIQALNVIRMLIKIKLYPPISSLSGIVGHMCQNERGSFLASELIIELISIFQKNKTLMVTKPNSLIFASALTGCVTFNITKKGEEIVDLVSRIGLRPRSELLVIMAIVYERNGRRDELRKLKRYVKENFIGLSDLDLMQFYECLFLCDLKFGDFSSCFDLVLDMLVKAEKASRSVLENENDKDYKLVDNIPPNYMPFLEDTNFSALEKEAKGLLNISSNRLRARVKLVKFEHGKLYPTEELYAKLVKGFLEAGRIDELASYLIEASKLESPVPLESSVAIRVMNVCISLGFLDHAHDLLDEMRLSRIKVCGSVYSNLLMAYETNSCQDEINTLLKDARQDGIELDYKTVVKSQSVQNIKPTAPCDEVNLTAKLLEEIKQNPSTDRDANDWNNVIHVFCKKKMMNDAKKAFTKMKINGHEPNGQTYHSLITAYASIGGKYTEVADLWGEMKILSNSNSIKFDHELLDSLLYCFVRGGFFLRAMEVIEIMERKDVFIDKYKYRSLWLKYHRTLYKGKVSKRQNEAQLVRREAALSFKRWIGLT